jgi:hypothetical protein
MRDGTHGKSGSPGNEGSATYTFLEQPMGSNPLGYHLKTGHTLSLQNRPTDFTQDTKMLYRAGRYSGKSFFDWRRPRGRAAGGSRKGDFSGAL